MGTDGFYVDLTAKIGMPFRLLQGCVPSEWASGDTDLQLPSELYVGAYAVIGEGVRLGERVIIESFCSVDPNAEIGDDTLLIYRAAIGGYAKVGVSCVIGAFIPENAVIGDRCRVFGNIVHRHNDTTESWDHRATPEASVVMNEDSFVGFGSTVVGGIEIGPRSYICAGSLVTKNVPPDHIASGRNCIVHYTEWHGALRDNPIFEKGV